MVREPISFDGQTKRVVDGDTIDVHIDLYFSLYHSIRLRLAGVDTAEIFGQSKDSEEYKQGAEQREFVKEWLTDAATNHDGDWPIHVLMEDTDVGIYGRYTARIERKDTLEDLSTALIAEYPDVVSNYEW